MKRESRFRKKRRHRQQNRTAMFLVSLVVLMMLIVVAVKSMELTEKKAYYAKREAELTTQIAKEEDRAKEIAEYETYTQTMKYVEEVARDRLGLVYEGEILFIDKN